ncbi:hypothetical protein NMY22_g8873 [Coprinellus aureogranulatus]|nr:hypothetical protein NMY22_g8873 [Coprinellus aureogranulatus]
MADPQEESLDARVNKLDPSLRAALVEWATSKEQELKRKEAELNARLAALTTQPAAVGMQGPFRCVALS